MMCVQALAARRVGGFKDTISLHYISQTSAEMGADDDALPAEVVLRADVEVQQNPYKPIYAHCMSYGSE